ncbi:MAG: vacuolar-type H+-ATPase subunit D/Vma8 [Planctomycetota bacterium]
MRAKQVRFHETEVELARVRLAALASKLEDARQGHEVLRAKVESLKAAS